MKTSELTGATLDWAVATADGEDYFKLDLYAPSKLWEQGGLIIESEEISVIRVTSALWDAHMSNVNFYESGTTPLEAAMRCYVASKLGDEVEVPEELLSCAHA